MDTPDLVLLTVSEDGRILDAHPKQLGAAVGQRALDWLDPLEEQVAFEGGILVSDLTDHPVWVRSGRLFLLTTRRKDRRSTWVLQDVSADVPSEDLIRHSPIPLALWTLSYHLVFSNQAFRDLVGEAAATTDSLWDPKEAGPKSLASVTAIRTSALSSPSSDVKISATLIPCTAQGRPVGILSIHQDITGAVRDAVGQEEGVTRQTVASILHEVRNPLATVRGFLQLLESDAKGQMKEWCALSIRELDRASKMLEDMGSLAQPHPDDLNSFHLVEAMASLTETVRFRHGPGKLKFDVPPGLKILCNKNLVTQVLVNLVLNGIEAGPPVTVRARRQGNAAVVTVTDSGSGIPKDIVDHIFEPFFTTKRHGNGLGLHIVRALVDRMGGRIEVSPRTRGAGARFTVVLPARESEGEEDVYAES